MITTILLVITTHWP